MPGWLRRARYRLWAFTQWALAPGYQAMLQRQICQRFAGLPPGRWLDVGCAGSSVLAGLLPGWVVGLDLNRASLAQASSPRQFKVCGNALALPFADQSFDGVVCFGLLHHLDDHQAKTALAEMQRVARAAAPVLVFDAVRPATPWRQPLAHLLRAMDRGRHMRSRQALPALVQACGLTPEPVACYAWTGLEACWAFRPLAPVLHG